jgi:hypothetical protein
MNPRFITVITTEQWERYDDAESWPENLKRALARPGRGWKDNIKMYVMEIRCWCGLNSSASEYEPAVDLVNTVIKFLIP